MATLNTQFVYRSHRLDPDMTISSLIDRVPACLPFLVRLGFVPLADPVVRERYAPRVTLRQAAETLPINLERLLTDLERIADAEEAP